MVNNRQQDVSLQIEKNYINYEKMLGMVDTGIALFGAGQFGISALKYLKKNNYKITCFIDNSSCKHGTVIDDIPVVSFDHELATSSKVILITAKHAVLRIKEQIGNKILSMSFDAWFVLKNKNQYEHIRNNILSDERSQQCIDGILMTMLSGNEKYCADIMDFNQYFCLPQFVNTGDDYFVDAGAYVGDTIEKFLWANNGGFKKIYAFEPGKLQFNALVKRIDRLVEEWALNPNTISLINSGLSDNNGEASIIWEDGMPLPSTNLDTENYLSTKNKVKVYSLDKYLSGSQVSFIKSDIEGMELRMLNGAKETIKKNKPKMALSTYHEPDDLFQIIDFIESIDNKYKMALRHHSPLLMETILYCWIEE